MKCRKPKENHKYYIAYKTFSSLILFPGYKLKLEKMVGYQLLLAEEMD